MPLLIHLPFFTCMVAHRTRLSKPLSQITHTHNASIAPSYHTPLSRRFHPHMLIRYPKHHLPIPTCAHIVPWIPPPHTPTRLARQPAHRRQHLRILIHRGLRIPDQGIVVFAAGAEHVAAVGAEGDVALAEGAGGARGGAGGGLGLLRWV